MAIDRTSSSDDVNDELGVLDDLSTSTTAIDLGTTAQVAVVLPAGYQDDDRDDDVIADELDPSGEDRDVDDVADGVTIDDEDSIADEVDAAVAGDPAEELDEHDEADEQVAVDEASAEDHIVDDEDDVDEADDSDDVGTDEVDDTDDVDELFEQDELSHHTDTDVDDSADDEPEPVGAAAPRAGAIEPVDDQSEGEQEDIIVREPDPVPAAVSQDTANHVEKVARTGRESFVRQPRSEADVRRDPESSDVLTDDRLLDTGAIRKPEPEDPWRRIVYAATRGLINLGDGKKTRARKELIRRIAAPLPGRVRFVPVMSRKGGVGKTTVTALLGMALADARDDRVVAIDANPDRGTLAERISKPSGKTVRDLVRGHADITGYADMTAHVTRDVTRLDVLASDADPHVADAFSDQNYRDVAEIAQHYYSLVLTDTGTGIIHSVMDATLDLGDQIVIVSGISVDEARLAAETLTWLETNGHEQLAQRAVVVINQDRPGTPLVRLDELETHFRSRVRDVVRIPYDAAIATGSAISFHDLDRTTRDAARRLAATVVEGIRAS